MPSLSLKSFCRLSLPSTSSSNSLTRPTKSSFKFHLPPPLPLVLPATYFVWKILPLCGKYSFTSIIWWLRHHFLNQVLIDIFRFQKPYLGSCCMFHKDLMFLLGTHLFVCQSSFLQAFPVAQLVKNPPANAGEAREESLILGLGRSPGVANGNPLQCSCLENSMDGGAWWATVHGVARSQTQLNTCVHTHTHTHTHTSFPDP